MEKYIGTKIVQATPAIRKGGNIYLPEWPIPKSMEPVEDGYKVIYADGYESWSPKDVFESAYRKIGDMTFGLAVEALKAGKKVARNGWNGKGMFVVYQKGYPAGIPCNKQTAEAWDMNEGEPFICNSYIQIRCVNGSHSMWVPSINDVLAEDWIIVE